MEKKSYKRCRECNEWEGKEEDRDAWCCQRHCYVWGDSVACNLFDDTIIF